MQEYDSLQKYQDTLSKTHNTTAFQRRFGQHHLYQKNHWKQYAFHDCEDKLQTFSFISSTTYSCAGQTNIVQEYIHDDTGLEFVVVPGGKFVISDNITEMVLEPFLMSKYVVTQGVWKTVMKTQPWHRKQYVVEGDFYPATYVSWDEATEFCEKIGLYLPSEAQWEYACRAGTNTKYYWGDEIDNDYFWHKGNTWDVEKKYAPQVGQKKPNAFGLFDMSGNVWEWCRDWYSHYASINTGGSNCSTIQVVRGGSWFGMADFATSNYRNPYWYGDQYQDMGFRCVYMLA